MAALNPGLSETYSQIIGMQNYAVFLWNQNTFGRGTKLFIVYNAQLEKILKMIARKILTIMARNSLEGIYGLGMAK